MTFHANNVFLDANLSYHCSMDMNGSPAAISVSVTIPSQMFLYLTSRSVDVRTAYPDAHAGILVMPGGVNPRQHSELEARKQLLHEQLRSRFAGTDRNAVDTLPILQAYKAYYRRFKQSYHVERQLESIVFKSKRPGSSTH